MTRGKVFTAANQRVALHFLHRVALLAILLVFGNLSVFAQSSPSPRQLKEDAIDALDSITISDKKLQYTIAKAKKAIARSISYKNQSRFLDERRIVPPPQGKKVFDYECYAIKLLAIASKSKKTPLEIKATLGTCPKVSPIRLTK